MHLTSVLDPETEVRPFETCSFLWGSHNYLGEELAFLHNGLIEEPDEALTPDAAALRACLFENVVSEAPARAIKHSSDR